MRQAQHPTACYLSVIRKFWYLQVLDLNPLVKLKKQFSFLIHVCTLYFFFKYFFQETNTYSLPQLQVANTQQPIYKRHLASLAMMQGKVYIYGGFSMDGNQMIVYDPSTTIFLSFSRVATN